MSLDRSSGSHDHVQLRPTGSGAIEACGLCALAPNLRPKQRPNEAVRIEHRYIAGGLLLFCSGDQPFYPCDLVFGVTLQKVLRRGRETA